MRITSTFLTTYWSTWSVVLRSPSCFTPVRTEKFSVTNQFVLLFLFYFQIVSEIQQRIGVKEVTGKPINATGDMVNSFEVLQEGIQMHGLSKWTFRQENEKNRWHTFQRFRFWMMIMPHALILISIRTRKPQFPGFL